MVFLDEKHQRLRRALRDLDRVAVAFSAGVDSTFLLKVAVDVLGPAKVLAVTGTSDSLARAELEEASALAKAIGAEHVVIETDEFDDPDYTSNPTNRCYHCRMNLYRHMERELAKRGAYAIVSGTNADDLGDYRPGITAAGECGVTSPVAEVGLTKAEVRALSGRLGLSTVDKPASPCLSSRVPYGEPITSEKMRMIEAGERFLRELGIGECRVRHHGNLARIEVAPESIPTLAEPEVAGRVNAHFCSLGYNYVSLDLGGFRSGSLNEVISKNGAPA